MSANLTPEELTVRLHRVMDAANGLPAEDIDQVETLIRVGERLVAFETLCTQLYEYEIALEEDLVRQMVEVGRHLGADPSIGRLLGPQG